MFIKNILIKIIAVCFLLTSHPAFAAEYLKYRMRDGDSLSGVLFHLNVTPIYGKNGYLRKVKELNSSKIKKNGIVFHNTTILIPFKSLPKSENYKIENGYVTVTKLPEDTLPTQTRDAGVQNDIETQQTQNKIINPVTTSELIPNEPVFRYQPNLSFEFGLGIKSLSGNQTVETRVETSDTETAFAIVLPNIDFEMRYGSLRLAKNKNFFTKTDLMALADLGYTQRIETVKMGPRGSASLLLSTAFLEMGEFSILFGAGYKYSTEVQISIDPEIDVFSEEPFANNIPTTARWNVHGPTFSTLFERNTMGKSNLKFHLNYTLLLSGYSKTKSFKYNVKSGYQAGARLNWNKLIGNFGLFVDGSLADIKFKDNEGSQNINLIGGGLSWNKETN